MIAPDRPRPYGLNWILALCLCALNGGGCATAQSLERFEYVQPKMGTAFRIVLYAPDADTADTAAAAAYARIDELNSILSDYDPDSELSRLSNASVDRAPTPFIAVSDDLWRVLWTARHWSRQSDGAFDVTVGPLMRLWRRQKRQGELPTPQRLEQARASVGYQFLELDPAKQAVRLRRPDMRLDLGGIAKGYTVDQVLHRLDQHGIEHALVDGGGDIGVSAAPPGARGWHIAVRSIDAPDAPPAEYLELEHCAVATSGDTFKFVEIDGVRYSHIMNPATGIGLTERVGVTIVAPDCMTADALASAVSVMGMHKGLELISAVDDVAARIVTLDDGTPTVTQCPRFADLPRWLPDAETDEPLQ